MYDVICTYFPLRTVLFDWLLKRVIYSEDLVLGGRRSDYDRHHLLLTAPMVKELLVKHGFSLARVKGHPPSGGPRFLRYVAVFLVKIFPKELETL